ncbi:MAG TPA: ABC transporter substrate-binding protein [Acetobacteraceae bacterium]|nr:ABC transporter substrate-binding protein [Acetobacteraceae bacterium]
MLFPRRVLLAAGASLPFLPRIARAASAPNHLTFGLSSYPPNLHPWINAGTAAGTSLLAHHRGLLSYAADGSVQGELAAHWEPDGGSGWIFHLRDASFHNGQPADAASVKWSFEQIAAPHSTAYLRSQFQGIAAIEVPDAHTVRVIMKEPTVTLPDWLAPFYSSVVAPGTASPGKLPVGCGPFVLKSYERGVALDFAAFDKYYKPGLPKLKTMRFVAYPDENLRVAALEAGNVDLIEYVPWQSMGAIAANPKLKMESTLGPFMYLTFNARSGPFKDPRVRQAVGFAIKRSDIVNAAFFGRGAPLGGMPIPEGTPFYDAKLADFWTYDPDRAKKLLAEAGLAKGFSCTLLSTTQYGMHKITAEVVQQDLAAIGINVTLNLPDWATRVALGNRGQYEFAVMGSATESNDPDGLSPLIDGTLSPSYERSYDLVVPGLHALLAAGRAQFDQAKRKAIYDKVQDLALQYAPVVTLCWRSQAYAMKKNLQGFANLPGALTFYSGYSFEDTYFD